ATESNNLALKGVAFANSNKGNKIITSKIEHKSVLDPCLSLQKFGFEIIYLNVDSCGFIDIDEMKKVIDEKTILVSIITANNEIGTIQNLEEIGEICKDKSIILHTDGTQAIGKIPFDVGKNKVDIASFSAHKIYGPKGIGALYIRKSTPKISIIPLIDGGGHEKGLRSGTLNVPGIVGFGKACELAINEMSNDSEKISKMRDKLFVQISRQLENIKLNGPVENRLPGNLNICFRNINSDRLMIEMKEIALSSGSACSSALPEPSHVLKAIGLNDDEIKSSVRFGIGKFNTNEEIDYVIDKICSTVSKIKNLEMK
ncbi:MAG: cysteine desulfurase, partial [Ignavibacteria bacterium]|nr:cysteine desulfurase [Ignavibacteria bacterium]